MTTNTVDIVRYLHNEFGIQEQVIINQIHAGKVTIDGRVWEGDKFQIPAHVIEGKVLNILGPDRKFRVVYRGDQE